MIESIGRTCSTDGEINANRILVGDSERNRHLWRPTCSCEHNIKIIHKERVGDSVDCIRPLLLVADLTNTAMNLQVA
jgi:hypothetical protein